MSRAPNNNKQPCTFQTSLRNLLFHLVQHISLHFNSTDLYLFCTTKVFPKFLNTTISISSKFSKWTIWLPMTMQHGRCHWSRTLCCALWQVSGRACSCRKDPCCVCVDWNLITWSTNTTGLLVTYEWCFLNNLPSPCIVSSLAFLVNAFRWHIIARTTWRKTHKPCRKWDLGTRQLNNHQTSKH